MTMTDCHEISVGGARNIYDRVWVRAGITDQGYNSLLAYVKRWTFVPCIRMTSFLFLDL